MARLSISDVTLERAGRIAVRGFSAELDSGSALTIQGLNGSGKTTLLRALAGFIAPSAGSITWDGLPLCQEWRGNGGRIAYVGHQDGIKNDLTALENLAFWSGLMGLGRSIAALEAMGLSAVGTRPARHLSAGQRRRLSLSRLFLGKWDLWILDEPLSALDAPARTIFVQQMRRQLDEGGMAVIAQHEDIAFPGPKSVLEAKQ
jgi:heme exporter protein A